MSPAGEAGVFYTWLGGLMSAPAGAQGVPLQLSRGAQNRAVRGFLRAVSLEQLK